jgi:hypothetical protein
MMRLPKAVRAGRAAPPAPAANRPLTPPPLSQTRSMPLKELQEKFPGDFTAAALQEIRERCGEMARKAEEEATAAALAAGPGGRAAKRGREPDTVLHTVCAAPRGVPAMPPPRLAAPPPKFADAPAAAPAAAAAAPAAPMATPPPPAVPRPRPAGSFNGVPLQTPMPFAGVPVPLPVALLAQRKPGGRTRAAPDAAVVTTADGQQFAVGRGGVGVVPASHRAEVADLMRQQLEFFAAALGGAAALARR